MKQSRPTNRGALTCPERRPRAKNVVDHIPRPANAFMLFRSDFVKQRHKPGSFETNHCSSSKDIGTRWKLLTDEDKAVWYMKATIEKAKHQEMYPDYRYRPSYRK
ncbi:high mobility group box domain-containing protein, partial [Lentinula lateritia]